MKNINMQIAFILSIFKWVQRWQVPWIGSTLAWVLGVSGGKGERWRRKRGRADLLLACGAAGPRIAYSVDIDKV